MAMKGKAKAKRAGEMVRKNARNRDVKKMTLAEMLDELDDLQAQRRKNHQRTKAIKQKIIDNSGIPQQAFNFYVNRDGIRLTMKSLEGKKLCLGEK